MRQLYLSGDHFAMGKQHGHQVTDLKPHILSAIQHRLDKLAKVELNTGYLEEQMLESWHAQAEPLLEMMQGISEALSLDWRVFFRYTIATFLMDMARQPQVGDQGCTTWAVLSEATRDGIPLLVKNRDYWPDHQELQCLAHTRPDKGYVYLNMTSAGSPGVFSSGINEAGLAVSDTHVSSLDIGPGLPRYYLMMEILEHHDTVHSAVDYLRSVNHAGNGTLLLLDANGEAAVFECGQIFSKSIPATNGFVVSANHYVTPALRQKWMFRTTDRKLIGSSLHRYSRVKRALLKAKGSIDLNWAINLMRQHGTPLNAICRHPELNPQSVTISSAIYLPTKKQLYLVNGIPCQNEYQVYPVIPDVQDEKQAYAL